MTYTKTSTVKTPIRVVPKGICATCIGEFIVKITCPGCGKSK